MSESVDVLALEAARERMARWREVARRGPVVYVVHDDHGPLYVGMTGNLSQRIARHRTTAPWWSAARAVVIERLGSRAEAAHREFQLIADLAPPHNTPADPGRLPR